GKAQVVGVEVAEDPVGHLDESGNFLDEPRFAVEVDGAAHAHREFAGAAADLGEALLGAQHDPALGEDGGEHVGAVDLYQGLGVAAERVGRTARAELGDFHRDDVAAPQRDEPTDRAGVGEFGVGPAHVLIRAQGFHDAGDHAGEHIEDVPASFGDGVGEVL